MAIIFIYVDMLDKILRNTKVKKSNEQGKYAIDQVRVENKQSELRLKANLRRE